VHILQFKATEAKQTWDTALEQSNDWLASSNTAPNIRAEIMDGLQKWQSKENNPSKDMTSNAAMEQELLGWDLAMEGCISRQWRQQQDKYWKTYKT